MLWCRRNYLQTDYTNYNPLKKLQCFLALYGVRNSLIALSFSGYFWIPYESIKCPRNEISVVPIYISLGSMSDHVFLVVQKLGLNGLDGCQSFLNILLYHQNKLE